MDKSNATWLRDLRGSGVEQQAALSDLRNALLRGLRRALSGHAHASDAFLEDIVQEALLRILDRLAQFKGRSRFVTWATSIAIRMALSELRRRRWQDVSLEDVVSTRADFAAPRATDEGSDPPLETERRAILAHMYAIIHRELTEKQRTALLAELKGMPQAEIARHLGSNRNAVYKLTHDARKRLKRGLEASGYHAEDIHGAFAL